MTESNINLLSQLSLVLLQKIRKVEFTPLYMFSNIGVSVMFQKLFWVIRCKCEEKTESLSPENVNANEKSKAIGE